MKKILLLVMLGLANMSYGQFTAAGPYDTTTEKVGIGLTNPTARTDIRLRNDFIGTDESGLRVTYPNVAIADGGFNFNKSVFEVRRAVSIGSSTNYSTDFLVKRNGRVGIGTDDPQTRFDIRMPDKQEIVVQSTVPNTYGGFLFNHSDGTANWRIRAYSNFAGGYDNILGIQSAGGAGELWIAAKRTMIGDWFDFDPCGDCDDYKLFVKKGIRTEKVKVDLASGIWADYVFEENYNLKPLNEVENFINKNGHLPNIPSAKEVEENGLNLGEMDALLLEKIEELTLYLIDLKKENEVLKSDIVKLQKSK